MAERTGEREADPRALALRLIAGVLRDRRMLSDLETQPEIVAAPPPVRARAGRLARATLRRIVRADAALGPLLNRPPVPEVRDVLRLATVEMLAEGAPPHGVVNAAVALVRKRRPRDAGFVNAVLRRVAEEGRTRWDTTQPQRLPKWLRGRMSSAWGNARVAAMEALFEQAPPLDLTPRDAAGGPALAEALGGTLLPGGSVRIDAAGALTERPGYAEGAWWVQDAGAALAARALAAKPGERVLDLCAAPGGKTLQLAAAGADVTALDISEARLVRLRENLARCRLTAEVVVADALEWAPDRPFDAILLDAPCSATGTIRRHPDLPFVRDGEGLRDLVALQAALIDRAAGWLAPGGRLVYCTCSLLPAEGEAQVAAALERHPGLGPEPVVPPDPAFAAGPGEIRVTPEMWADRGGIDGFYVALLRQVETDRTPAG